MRSNRSEMRSIVSAPRFLDEYNAWGRLSHLSRVHIPSGSATFTSGSLGYWFLNPDVDRVGFSIVCAIYIEVCPPLESRWYR